MQKFNLYCDESCYLENDNKAYMIMGTIKCPKESRKIISKEIRDIKKRHGIAPFQEVKWTKISDKKKDLYKDLISYFFKNDDLSFRSIIVDKRKINHEKFNQNHNDFYYKVYYQLLIRGIIPNNENFIYLDIKDTKNNIRVKTLEKCLLNGSYDYDSKYIKRIQTINSKESEIMQLTDILIGAIGFIKRNEVKKDHYSKAKYELANEIMTYSGYNFSKSTFLSEEKFNIFIMELKDGR